MQWTRWIGTYVDVHCAARGLRLSSRRAYLETLNQFRQWIECWRDNRPPDRVRAGDVREYLQHLRARRGNGDAAINRQLTILRGFYRGLVATGYVAPSKNPLAGFPSVHAVPRKLPLAISAKERRRLIDAPPADTVLGARDRAVLGLIYGAGIRAGECATLREGDVDLSARAITVHGNRGDEWTVLLDSEVARLLRNYVQLRGLAEEAALLFRSRSGTAISRSVVFQRVRHWKGRAGLGKQVLRTSKGLQ